MPLATLAGLSQQAGHLSRLGPITAEQARQLSALAVTTPATNWRVIVTSPAGQAFAVARIPRRRTRGNATATMSHGKPAGTSAESGNPVRSGVGAGMPAGSYSADGEPRPSRPSGRNETSRGRERGPAGWPAGTSWTGWEDKQTGVVGRVTITVAQDTLARLASQPPGGIAGRAVRAAVRAALRAAQRADADAAAGGCAHTTATVSYRPPPRLHEQVTARDLTCRFPTCRQPAWRGDLDHTQPYEQGGLTCGCNLGGLCRTHHILKQHPRWQLVQSQPGQFTWTTPAGRSYLATPDPHPI